MTKTQLALLKIMEECDELSQRCSKTIQFGIKETQKGQVLNNIDRITLEYNDLLASIIYFNNIEGNLIVKSDKLITDKLAKLEKYYKYAIEMGNVT